MGISSEELYTLPEKEEYIYDLERYLLNKI